jgi:hypothetical protein
MFSEGLLPQHFGTLQLAALVLLPLRVPRTNTEVLYGRKLKIMKVGRPLMAQSTDVTKIH